MLFLSFRLDRNRYLLDVRDVVEVLPLAGIIQIPHAPPGVAGIFNYRGTLVPVIDLSQVVLGRPARPRLHTRIVLARYTDDGNTVRQLGLIAEKATEIMRREPGDFTPSGIDAPHLGEVTDDDQELAQKIAVCELLPGSVRERLFRQPALAP